MTLLLKRLLAPVCFAAIASAATGGSPAATPMPKLTGPIPVTADSAPFLSATRVFTPLDLKKAGYVEEEYMVSGTANVYDWAADGSLTVKTPNAPYSTRILVRRPADKAKFSGHAMVELMNPARRFDWAMMSGYTRDSLIERGDAWVGITMPGSVDGLKKFNAARYPGVGFPNPDPSETCAGGRGNTQATSDQEEGLRWDMISQVGAAVKNGAGLNAKYLYMTSQGADVLTYAAAIETHAALENGKPVYDGFLVKTPGGVSKIRRCGAAIPKGDPRQTAHNIGVPVIEVVAQGEIGPDYQRPDSDDKRDPFRIYEVAGAAHIDKWAYLELPTMEDQLKASGAPGQGNTAWPFAVKCEPEIALQEHPLLKYIFDGAFVNLEQWASKGVAPPKAERITMKDGVASGGVRNSYVDVPAATYTTTTPGPGTCRELGSTNPYDSAKVDSLYGDHKKYEAKVAQSVDQMLKDRWITKSDAQKIKAEAAGK
jgi:Alpha/beta hydrolase domain